MNWFRHTSWCCTLLFSLGTALTALQTAARAEPPYPGWKHAGALILLTTPEGANLPPTAALEGFPVLVRLQKDFFYFKEAQPRGEDVRFSTPSGTPLPYQIEEWDPAAGRAAVWVRIPLIRGNARQEIRMHWGRPDAVSESSGAAVFNASNGYVSVWHLDEPTRDEVGSLGSVDRGTTATAGIIGRGRHFAGGQGLFGGNKIDNYPAGGSPHSTEAWFRAEKPNVTLIGWGNEVGVRGSKVRMQLRSPPHVHIDSNFSDVSGESTLPLSEWVHVVHTYEAGEGRIYINGKLDGKARPTLNIRRPSRLWIGGWYDNYDFAGDMDEVRISQVDRSADWVRLEYENQKPSQTLVGPLVQGGAAALSVFPEQAVVPEGKSTVVTAQVGSAQKVYWTLSRAGRETVVGVDQRSFIFAAGRVVGDESVTLKVTAIYADGSKTKEVRLLVKEDIPEPAFTLQAPDRWDGRATIPVVPKVSNLPAMQARGAGKLNYRWSVSGIAVYHEAPPERLLLRRAQNSGPLTVTLSLDNGGAATVRAVSLQVREPRRDPWSARAPAPDEKPVDNQFYAREAGGTGTLYYNGNLATETVAGNPVGPADAVILKIYAGERLIDTQRRKLAADRSYALSAKLPAGLVKYRAEFGIISGGRETVQRTVNNLVCGDAYLINGQSNAQATAWGNEEYSYSSDWIRSFGTPDSGPQAARSKVWANAVARRAGGMAQIGYWGMELARRLLEGRKVPICILNGAVGGTRIDQHQRNPADPEDASTIYGRLLWRVRAAGLTHGIRGILWHQGENDQGADGPTGGYGWETYQQYFVDLASGWKRDYPNVRHYYVFQIWPKSCAMGINGSDNRLREVQRRLPALFSHLTVMSTLGVKPPGDCHYPPAGYAEIARLIAPVVEQFNYGKASLQPVTPPDLKSVSWTGPKQDELALRFDQPIAWNSALADQFYLDGQAGKVLSGTVTGSVLTLKLAPGLKPHTLAYLDSKKWSQSKLLYGENGLAALTFCEVRIPTDPLHRQSHAVGPHRFSSGSGE